MPLVIFPKDDLKRLLKERRAWGADRYDEVWDGVYVMSPEADIEHQKFSYLLTRAVDDALIGVSGADVYPSLNISDRATHWRKNYRVPDVSVFLAGNPAENRKSHWFGGPDFAVEILSPRDRSRKKFDFYAKVGVRELLFVNRRPWSLELYRRQGDGWELVGSSDPETSAPLASAVLPLNFRLLPAEPRPRLEICRNDGGQRWLA